MSCVLKHIEDSFFSFFSIQNTESNCYIIFLKFFAVVFFWWKLYSFPVIFIYKWFNFCCPLWSFFISFWFNVPIIAYWKHLLSFSSLYDLFLLFCFLSNLEKVYMTHHNSDVFNDIYNTLNKHNWRQTQYFSSILNYFEIYF